MASREDRAIREALSGTRLIGWLQQQELLGLRVLKIKMRKGQIESLGYPPSDISGYRTTFCGIPIEYMEDE